jgi:tyrosine-protein phosphatase YwqE
MFSFFKKSRKPDPALENAPKNFSFLSCDMHSHLVPAVDDGSKSLEDSLNLIRGLRDKGYTKLITTPHVQLEFYDNNREKLTKHFTSLKRFIADQRIGIELEIAAEYYLDNMFLSGVLPDGLLSFGDNYVLVEVSMAGWPHSFSDMIFSIQSLGYKPILAHPERYLYEENVKTYLNLKEKGVMMQMNLLSILGYYGKTVKSLAERFLYNKVYDFCGSDLHHERHLNHIDRISKEHPEIMIKLADYGFRNDTLLLKS